jgi:hypothetical protein
VTMVSSRQMQTSDLRFCSEACRNDACRPAVPSPQFCEAAKASITWRSGSYLEETRGI